MKIEIFDVEMGNCILVTDDTGARMLIDCGHNSSTGWRPSNHLPHNGIRTVDMLVVSNYDNDHVSDLPQLRQNVCVHTLLRNSTVVSPAELLELKSEKGIGPGIRELSDMIRRYTKSVQLNWGTMTTNFFYNSYRIDFTDTNNLSVVTFVHYGNFHAVFPGDLERAGWERLLCNQAFVAQLRTVNLFMASHHGRENGICEAVFDECSPDLIVISDKGIIHDTQYTTNWYGQRVKNDGMFVNSQFRKVLTTRNDGKITIDSDGNGMTVSTWPH